MQKNMAFFYIFIGNRKSLYTSPLDREQATTTTGNSPRTPGAPLHRDSDLSTARLYPREDIGRARFRRDTIGWYQRTVRRWLVPGPARNVRYAPIS
jgi:hypothetical protein